MIHMMDWPTFQPLLFYILILQTTYLLLNKASYISSIRNTISIIKNVNIFMKDYLLYNQNI